MASFNKVLASLIQLLALSSGRDKFCRLIQYYCKFLATLYREHHLIMASKRDNLKIKLDRSEALMGAMGMTRKVLRFGPSIAMIKTVVSNINDLIEYKTKEPEHIVVLRTLSASFLSIFFVFDHYSWLSKVGLINNPELRVKLEYYSALAWFLDCLTCIAKNIALYQNYKPEERKTYQIPLAIDMVRVICDTPIAISFVNPGSINGKVSGLLGTVTSTIGIYQMWN